MPEKITKRFVDGLQVPEGTTLVRVYDTELQGFGVTRYASGRTTFFFEYGPRTRRQRMKLGDFGPLTVDMARKLAEKHRGQNTVGHNPLDEKRRQGGIPTFQEWVETYMVEVERRKKAPDKDRQFLKLAVKRWGTRRLDKLTAEDVRRVFEQITLSGGRQGRGAPIHANRWLASIRACLQAAWREDKIPENPARKVRPNPENPPRDRVLSDGEYQRLVSAVMDLDDPYERAALTMLMETGCRLSELLRARWEDLDLDAGVWRMPLTKSGRPQTIPLQSGVAAVLRVLPRCGPYIIPGRDPEHPRSTLRGCWARLKAAAELGDDIRIHDIRRTYGLHVARSAGLHVASRLLRHSGIGITERVYAPLGLDHLREGLELREASIVHLKKPVGRKK